MIADEETKPARTGKPSYAARWLAGGVIGATLGVAASLALSVYNILPIDDLKKLAGTETKAVTSAPVQPVATRPPAVAESARAPSLADAIQNPPRSLFLI